MKQVLFAITALIVFLLILQFGPNGLYRREQAITNEISTAQGSAVPNAALASATTTDSTAATPSGPTPTIDTDRPSAPATASASTPAPVQPVAAATTEQPATPAPAAPVETAQATPPAAPAPVVTEQPAAVPAAAPAPETPATSSQTVATVTPPAAAPAPEPAPAVAQPAPAPAAPEPTPAPVAATTPPPAPAPVVTPAPTTTATTSAPVVAAAAATPAPAAPVKKAKLAGPKVVILGYYRFSEPGSSPSANLNRISAETFDKQLAWLRDNGFQVIPLSDLVARLKSGSPLPEHAAVITLNNGFNSATNVAVPILKKYGYPWSFLVYTDFIEQSPKAVTWTDLQTLVASGNVDVQSQSKSHPWLTDTTGKSAEQYDKFLTNELTGSKRMLEIKLKKPVTVLAYPYGNSNAVVEKKALALGYEAMLTTTGDPITASTSPLALGRLIQNQYTSQYFETLLSQKDFTVANAQPASGTLIHEGRPVISAKLVYAGNINPASVQAELSTGGTFKNVYDPATKTITFTPPKTLLEGPVIVVIKAKDQDTGRRIVVFWQFNFKA